ncbi:trypsin-like serine peptidase [Paraburkholderia aromaticivorans]|uniref:trypsin-like serine peptidase n=1 Tax=Paraburkholderia aromaticivorans TaxID=2026199 RepID=UPI001455ECB1|nr:trypsin-like serine protease [Paraburkholderia aromaticivorans]
MIKIKSLVLIILLVSSASILADEADPDDDTPKINHGPTYLPNDPRRPIDRLEHPEYNPIGIVQSHLGRGTGWLANDCIVWTAKHVLGRDKRVVGQSVKFYVGQGKPNENYEYLVNGVVVASGNSDGEDPDGGAQDWAFIRLEKPIGRIVGHIAPAQYSVDDALTCKTLEAVGFPGEKEVGKLWGQVNCRLISGDVTGFLVSCPVTPGESGGPLLCREPDGKLFAIGILNQRIPDKEEGLAVNFTLEWQKIKAAYLKHRDTCQ